MYDTRRQAADIREWAIDLRSDTVTRPDAAMQEVIAQAKVGDDVYGDDPNVNALEIEAALRAGKEAGAFFPSGTQSNLAAVMAHCGRGEEVILGRGYHIQHYEGAGASVLGSVALTAVDVAVDGGLEPEHIRAAIKPDDPHHCMSRLLSLENTHGGRAISLARMQAAADVARQAGLSVHLDGARFFNATTALGVPEEALAGIVDTVSLCLSKGLGAPVGSVLVGSEEVIGRARRIRKMLGGGMRQAGILAAAGRHALAKNVQGLKEDHRRAGTLAAHLAALPKLAKAEVSHATNMVFFTPQTEDIEPLRSHMNARGIALRASPRTRIVLHRDVSDNALDEVMNAFSGFYRQ